MKRLGEIALVAVATLVGLGVVEAYLRTQVPQGGVTIFETSDVPELRYRLRRSYSGLYFGVDIRTNSLGFRGPEPQDAAPYDTLRIALFGDSVTFGHVRYEETIGVQLQEQLLRLGHEAEVLNLGVPGYDADEVAYYMGELVPKLRPQIVLYLGYHNDAPRASEVPPATIDPNSRIDLFKTYPLGSALLEFVGRSVVAVMRSFGFDRDGQGYVASTIRNWESGGQDRFKGAIARMRSTSQASGACFVPIIVPYLPVGESSPFRLLERDMKVALEELSMQVHDLEGGFGAVDAKLRVGLYDDHPNKLANGVFAAGLIRSLLESDCLRAAA